ncbi:hypothetical protein ONZ43_g964 [Nemania bipapillata]|uniref:Uncharacterized protein n=1 Tax=Nemania bipapillata TaxID=110536 RepID=A0ACC2J655_9PEZI|nr:hypothetical protein ONZ43_g964 [Nemania bipapillata]
MRSKKKKPHIPSTLKKLGATDLVDYKSPDLAGALAQRLSGQRIAGAFDASGVGSSNVALANAVAQCQGAKIVSTVLDEYPGEKPTGVKIAPILAIAIRLNKVGKMVWEDFLPDALATGKYFIPYPVGFVAGKGLKKIQEVMDTEGDPKTKKTPGGQKAVVELT